LGLRGATPRRIAPVLSLPNKSAELCDKSFIAQFDARHFCVTVAVLLNPNRPNRAVSANRLLSTGFIAKKEY
jgi:hypothetical protein